MSSRPVQIAAAVFLTTVALLTLELLLIRVFDVILLPNIGYAVITLAMFASGLAGVYAAIRPVGTDAEVRRYASFVSLCFGASMLALRPALNAAPLIYDLFPPGAAKQLIGVSLMYVVLLVPFFLSGLILAYVFSAFTARIRSLYCWDLLGAAVGAVAFLPFLRRFGPGGLLFWTAALSILAAALLAGSRRWTAPAVLAASALLLAPVVKTDGYFEFRMQAEKRGVRTAQAEGLIEVSEWGPISKIDVIGERSGARTRDDGLVLKHVAYDGGSQSSHFYRFNGDYVALRRKVLAGSSEVNNQFWHRGVLASHYLKRDSGAHVLIVGSAAGQETKAALLFNASRVDGIELVDTVVRLGQGRYADYIGHIFNDPRVHNQVGEGRTFLRNTRTQYDILQIFSNHVSSNVAAGMGATTPVYLQTVEAYTEYFSHLKQGGVLHINHHFYPRMITTAARAWALLGRTDFQKHVVVFERPGGDTIPTMLVKDVAWATSEIEQLVAFFNTRDGEMPIARMVVDPLRPERSFLSRDFFNADLRRDFLKGMDYLVQPSTDDWPYFNNIQKHLTRVDIDRHRFLDETMTQALNGRLEWPLGEYAIFAVIGIAGVMLSAVIVLVPMRLSTAGQSRLRADYVTLGYFACLGAGFIIIELVLIQVFMGFVGFPLYAISVVICTMLGAAGTGSMAANRFGITPLQRWFIPFVGILICGTALVSSYPAVFARYMESPIGWRIVTSVLLIWPLAFFLGMPFPLGILALGRRAKGAIAWAWGTNALFTVIGGVLVGVLSMLVGFRTTLFLAMGIYATAFALFLKLRLTCEADQDVTTAATYPTAAPARQH